MNDKFSKQNVLTKLQCCIDYAVSIQNTLKVVQAQIIELNNECVLPQWLACFTVIKCVLKGIDGMLCKNVKKC